MYIKRAISALLRDVSETFPVILLTGTRKEGKTTLFEHLKEEERSYVTLDDLDERYMAKKDPALFLQRHKPPLIIDEIQYAQEQYGNMAYNIKNGIIAPGYLVLV